MAARKPRAERVRNGGEWTEARYWSQVRSFLRRAFRFWKPALLALKAAERPYTGPNKRQKKEYQCACCHNWFKRDQVEIDHIIECGSLKGPEDIAPFLARLTPEDPAAYQVLCTACHNRKTHGE